MKLEPGKFYKTRDGRKAIVYAVYDQGYMHVIHGAIFGENIVNICFWEMTGRKDRSCDTDRDLIAEWTEPRTGTVWVNFYPNSLFVYKTREDADINATDDLLACVEVKWTEGDGL